METIEIRGLEIWARHGVLDQERKVGNTFRVDVILTADLSRAMISDNVDDTINYAKVIEIIKGEMEKPSLLLEHVVWRMKNTLIDLFPAIKGGKITLSKLTPPVTCEVKSVGISTEW